MTDGPSKAHVRLPSWIRCFSLTRARSASSSSDLSDVDVVVVEGESAAKRGRARGPSTDTESNESGRRLTWNQPLESLQLLLTSQKYFSLVAASLLLAEAALLLLIIRFVPYTEIDYSTYMQQSRLFLDGERRYSHIKGDTGPVVYPAGFLYVYSALYWLTRGGADIWIAQYVFAQLYLFTLGAVFAIVRRCGSVPPYALIFICLSKRLHSIYVLRLFNEVPAMLFFYFAVLAWTTPNEKSWTTGSILFSLALSVKMNFLLYTPALLFLFYTSLGLTQTLIQIVAIVSTQVLLAAPFLTPRSNAVEYVRSAFNFGREFSWEWTVNWRWIGQAMFESTGFSKALLIAHTAGLGLCGLAWSSKSGGAFKLLVQGLKRPNKAPLPEAPTADHICTVLFLSNLVGIVFARSLHYQFYAWYAHQLVFLLWHCPFTVIEKLSLVAAIEMGWHTFPSSVASSFGLTFANGLVVLGTCFGGAIAGVGGRNGRGR